MDELGQVGSTTRVGQTERPNDPVIGETERQSITAAADRVDPSRVAGTALRVAGAPGDGVDPTPGGATPGGVVPGGAVGALQYGRVDPTNGRGINGATYTPKVEAQMRADRYHGFPAAVDEVARQTRSTPFISGDGQVRSLVEVPGQVNGKNGNFEYITNRDGTINHRHFAPDGRPIVAPEARIPGTSLLRGAGRIAAPIGAAMDLHDVITSPTPVKTAVEKAAGWAGAGATASLVGSVATPLLAGGIPGAIAYGGAVIGGGVLGYFGGEAAARRAINWLGF